MDIEDITIANTEAGKFWFSTETIAFFDSKVESPVLDLGNGRWGWVESTRNYNDTGRDHKIAVFTEHDADISYHRDSEGSLNFADYDTAYSILSTI